MLHVTFSTVMNVSKTRFLHGYRFVSTGNALNIFTCIKGGFFEEYVSPVNSLRFVVECPKHRRHP